MITCYEYSITTLWFVSNYFFEHVHFAFLTAQAVDGVGMKDSEDVDLLATNG